MGSPSGSVMDLVDLETQIREAGRVVAPPIAAFGLEDQEMQFELSPEHARELTREVAVRLGVGAPGSHGS